MYSNSKFKLGSAAMVDPADNPILIAGDRGNTGAGDGPATGGPNPAELIAGSRSGVGRLQKAGLGSSVHDTVANSRPVAKPTTSGGYDGSGINPSAGRPGSFKLPGNMLPQKPVVKPAVARPGARNPKLGAKGPRGRKGFLR